MMKRKKILLTYASYGSGHKAAVKYIQNYFESKNNNYEIKILDISEYNSNIGIAAETLFNFNFNHNHKAGITFTILYNLFNNKISTMPYRKVTEKLYNQTKLKKVIKDFDPDLTISTHFFSSILIAKYNNENIISSKLITVITDYKSHELWTRNFGNEDALIVSNEIIKNKLVSQGFDKNKIYPYGIPLSEKFLSSLLNKEEVYEKYKLNKDMPIFSFMCGSQGSIISYEYFKKFMKNRYNVHVIMFCGTNEKIKFKCEKLIRENNYKNVTILPFTTDVNNLLNVTDLVITKPGGLATTECLELKKPMMLIPGAGGPENHNAKFLVSKGVAINNKNIIEFNKNTKKIMKNPKIIRNMNKNLHKYEKNTSVAQIYKLSLKLLNQK